MMAALASGTALRCRLAAAGVPVVMIKLGSLGFSVVMTPGCQPEMTAALAFGPTLDHCRGRPKK